MYTKSAERLNRHQPNDISDVSEVNDVRAASREFVGKDIDLGKLASIVEDFFKADKYRTQRADHPKGIVIQATKGGVLRTLLAEDRAFTVTITGEPNHVKVSMGVGKWLKDLGIAAIEGFVITPILLFVEVPLALWSFEIEQKFWRYLEQQVELGLK